MNKSAPLGVFDSGVGGTSIWKEIINVLPNEDTIYLSDSKNAPYGNRSSEEIIDLSIKNTEYLLSKDCKIIVVACNTATTNAIEILRNKYDVPFIGIEPAIKPASLATKTNKIGILATKGTLNSQLFASTSKSLHTKIEIREAIGKGLVELIERGEIYSDKTKKLLLKYLTPMLDYGIDHLVLGCSHYPYLIDPIKEIVGENVKIIDSGFAVARQTENILHQKRLLNPQNKNGHYQFFTNTNKEVLTRFILHVKNENLTITELDF